MVSPQSVVQTTRLVSLRTYRENLEQLISRAAELALAGNWGEEAIQLNTHILELDDKIAGSYTRLARCFKEQGNPLGAREMYLQVLAFQPENRIALNNLSCLEKELRIKELIHSISNINSYEEAFATGVAAKRRNEIMIAITALKRAIELKPTKYALNALASAYRSANNLDIAEKIYKDILLRDDNLVSQVGLAAVYRDKGMLAEARKIYENVLRQNKENCHALNGLGGVYSDLGMLGDAEMCFEKALEIGGARDESIHNLEKLKEVYLAQNNSDGVTRIDAILAHLRNLKRD